MFLKKSLTVMKENFFTLFLAELVFLFTSFFFLVFAKSKLAAYVVKLQGFEAQAATIPQGADQAQLAQFLDSFQSATNEALLFIYVIIPVVFLCIWCITQSFLWKAIKGKEIKSSQRFFWNFFLISLLAFLIIILFVIVVPTEFSLFDATDTAIMKTLFAIVICFIAHTAIAVSTNDKFLVTLKKTGKTLKRWYRFILPFILYSIVLSGLLFLFLALFVTYTTGRAFFLPTIPLTLYLLVCMVVALWIKIVFYIKVHEVQ